MGKSKKQFKRFESVAYIMLELLDRAVEMKKLQLDELKMKREIEREKVESIPKMRPTKVPLMKDGESILDEVNKAFPNSSQKYPFGGLTTDQILSSIEVGKNRDYFEFISPRFGTIHCDCPQCQARKNAERKGDD